ncbi:MAG: hypothetical protein HRT36_07680 [Alphaproteobacteria bacterium]|nr:hypothetical protein [Alphaproteobacteria bacterium]
MPKPKKKKFCTRALFDLEEREKQISAIHKTLKYAGEQEQHAVVQSPIGSVANTLRYSTVGNMVQAAKILTTLVPLGNDFLIKARLKLVDRSFVESGKRPKSKLRPTNFRAIAVLRAQ